MNGYKSVFASKTIISSILVMVSTAASMAGYDIGDTGGWVNNIVALIGAVGAIYGRVTAVKKVKI